MSTGLESVDEQHRRLIELLNSLLEAMEDGRGYAEVGSIIEELRRYTAEHFSHEEACMARYGCPAAATNMREHREFARILADFTTDFEAKGGTSTLALRVEDQLAWWLEHHILATDVELRPCVRLRAAQAAPGEPVPAGAAPAGTAPAEPVPAEPMPAEPVPATRGQPSVV